ncbi:cytidine deaminase [Rhodospirillum centenum]|uniref:Cytidine deaminase n=1 Tax=Rhodospirillum centenum (strain ATCC 51521 / SW) TaxID=414684 RepID=B6IPF1_RHOCS|nr:cytidine deaminase [Rhodospirillum centenum]ACI99653.1 cytidine deaminase [Rhodospirillum centenum SW]
MPTPADLFEAAAAARARSYSPYSRFKVGAAIRAEDGTVHAGCNVENAAYPQGQCAEATAIGAMVMAGAKRIVEIAVVGGDAGSGLLCTPCGGCRQRIREFAGPDTPIHVFDAGGAGRSFTLGELLPHSFGPDNLGF